MIAFVILVVVVAVLLLAGIWGLTQLGKRPPRSPSDDR